MHARDFLGPLCLLGPLSASVVLGVLGMLQWSILVALLGCPVVHAILWLRASKGWERLLRELDSRIKDSGRKVV